MMNKHKTLEDDRFIYQRNEDALSYISYCKSIRFSRFVKRLFLFSLLFFLVVVGVLAWLEF